MGDNWGWVIGLFFVIFSVVTIVINRKNEEEDLQCPICKTDHAGILVKRGDKANDYHRQYRCKYCGVTWSTKNQYDMPVDRIF